MKILELLNSLELPFGIIPFSECEILKPHLIEKANIAPKTAIMLLAPYYVEGLSNRNVSLYAVSRDYHTYFTNMFNDAIPKLKEIYPDNSFVGFADHSPINEVAAASKAGLGAVGDNNLLINHIYGSYIFIGEILSDLPFSEGYRTGNGNIAECLHCGQCKEKCPKTDACLSAITQKKGDLTSEEKTLIIENGCAWGCDICQAVCPMNEGIRETEIDFFKADLLPNIDAEKINSMSDDEFKSRAYSWRGRGCILRNLDLLNNS